MTALFKEANNINLFMSLTKVNCPVYVFFVGKKGSSRPITLISEKYYKQLMAPEKIIFSGSEKSGHLIPVTEPKLMQEDVIYKILPRIKLVK